MAFGRNYRYIDFSQNCPAIFSVNPLNPIIQFIYNTTEFILAPIRDVISNVFGYSGILDFSPFIAMILIQVIYNIIVKIL